MPGGASRLICGEKTGPIIGIRVREDAGLPSANAMSHTPSRPLHGLQPLTADERRQSLMRTLDEAPTPGPVWIFAYGSLIWDPCFAAEATETAMLVGYRRAFNFWSVMSRGTPERPGLGLGLSSGGRCSGIVYRLAEPSREADLETLWAREMHGTVYEPRWLSLETPAGPRHAITFVTSVDHAQYTGDLDAEVAARIIARAIGEKGSCRDYLAATVTALARHAIDDPALKALLSLVDRYRAEETGEPYCRDGSTVTRR